LSDDNLPQKSGFSGTPDNEQNQNPEGEELEQSAASPAKVVELEGLIAQKEEELRLADARISELEQAMANKDSDIATLNQSLDESDGKLTKVNDSLAQAVASYKTLVIKSNPGVLAELVAGDSIESVNSSLENAKALVNRVKEGLEVEIVAARVPAGAPERTPPDLSALSPREKIQYAIGGKR